MSYDEGALIGLRDGPNIRQSWDGFQAFYAASDARLDAFFVKPVGLSPGYFDDSDVSGQSLWGIHLTAAPTLISPVTMTAFYFGSIMPKVAFFPRPGREETHTIGLRLLLSQDAFDGTIGGIGQVGTFSGRDVAAFAAHIDGGWTLPAPWRPRLGLRADMLSGGDDAHGTVHTFNALYPNYAYSTEATIEAPANLMQIGATAALHPLETVTVSYLIEGLWRYSTEDAFYAAPTFPLVPPDGTSRRFTGLEQQLRAVWRINQYIDLTGAYVHFEPEAFLSAAHAQAQDFGMTAISAHF
jgi:hypothetical protein